MNDDPLMFADEAAVTVAPPAAPPWRVLIVDDEPDVFRVSRLALGGLHVDGVPVELVSCSSASEARIWLASNPDTAAVVIDVVMESERSGLDLARWIRSELKDTLLRIVLRTGQPGRAPELEVMAEHDIHDYLAKADTTRTRLITTVTGAVRAYRDLRTMALQRAGLRRIIDATATLFESSEVGTLLGGILDQVGALLLPRGNALFFIARTPLFAPRDQPAEVIAATGEFVSSIGQPLANVVNAEVLADIQRALSSGHDVQAQHGSAHVFVLGEGITAALYVAGPGALGEWNRTLMSLYAGSAALALRNLGLWKEREGLLAAFSRFVPNDTIRLLGHGDVRELAVGEQVVRELTVMFVDLVGFTRLAETMAPVEVFRLLNAFYGAIGPGIARNGGIVDKYLGDGAMVLFPEGPEGACDAALAICAALDALNADAAAGVPPLRVGVAIHRGSVILGTIGHADRLDVTAVSDDVNIAARLQSWTRTLAARVIVSDSVAHAMGGDESDTRLRRLGSLPLRGHGAPIEVWERIDAEESSRREAKRRTRERFNAAMRCRTEGRLLEAARRFNAVLLEDPVDEASLWFSWRCTEDIRESADRENATPALPSRTGPNPR
jgi:class 3 adenylate cyclase/CheY-like chemotaxis protein